MKKLIILLMFIKIDTMRNYKESDTMYKEIIICDGLSQIVPLNNLIIPNSETSHRSLKTSFLRKCVEPEEVEKRKQFLLRVPTTSEDLPPILPKFTQGRSKSKNIYYDFGNVK